MSSHKKSVLMIGNFLSGSIGTRGISEDLRDRLMERGWRVAYASSRANRLLRLLDMLWTTYRHRQTYTVANVEVYSHLSFTWAEMVCRLLLALQKPVNLALHGGGLPDFARKHPVRVRRLLTSATRVNTPSKYLQESFSTIRPDIVWLPNGIDLSKYQPREQTYSKPHLMWLRAFHEIYNPQMAVEALAILRSEGFDCTLTMIGPDKHDGTHEATIKLAKSKGVYEAVQLTGAVKKPTVPEWLSRGDIFLNTTRIESFGVSVVEAAACGLPIVTTNVGELPYLWTDGVDALLVPPDDPPAMAAAVRRILSEPGLADRLLANARKKAERFDWRVVLPQWEELFESLILQ